MAVLPSKGTSLLMEISSVYTAFRTKIRTPGTNNFKITYTDATPTSEVFAGLGLGMDYTVAMNDGVKASFTIETTGAIT